MKHPGHFEGYLDLRRLTEVLDVVITFNLPYFIALHTFWRGLRRRLQGISTKGDL